MCLLTPPPPLAPLGQSAACAGLWMSTESVGDAGSNALGYFGGVFSPDGAPRSARPSPARGSGHAGLV